MLSLGTDVFLAFWMASYSVGLPAGSPPPVRAATSMFLISRANSLPRRASLTAFWCLVVAHLEWPLISYYLFCRSQFACRVYVGPRPDPRSAAWRLDRPVPGPAVTAGHATARPSTVGRVTAQSPLKSVRDALGS